MEQYSERAPRRAATVDVLSASRQARRAAKHRSCIASKKHFSPCKGRDITPAARRSSAAFRAATSGVGERSIEKALTAYSVIRISSALTDPASANLPPPNV